MLNINLQINENEAKLILKTEKNEFVEKYKIIDFDQTTLETKPIYEQLEDAGMNDKFIDDFYKATENFYIHDLLSLCYEWQ